MFEKTVAFRKEYGLDLGTSAPRLERVRKYWCGHYLDFTTTDGSPIQYFRFKHVDPKKIMKEVCQRCMAKGKLPQTTTAGGNCAINRSVKMISGRSMYTGWRSHCSCRTRFLSLLLQYLSPFVNHLLKCAVETKPRPTQKGEGVKTGKAWWKFTT